MLLQAAPEAEVAGDGSHVGRNDSTLVRDAEDDRDADAGLASGAAEGCGPFLPFAHKVQGIVGVVLATLGLGLQLLPAQGGLNICTRRDELHAVRPLVVYS
jgi:hypothetical protein